MTDAFREYLTRARRLAEDLKEQEEKRLALWAVCTKMSTTFGQSGGYSGGGGDAKDGSLAAYADLTRARDTRREKLRETENELRSFFQALECADAEYGKRDAAILTMRYLQCLEWNEIRETLEHNGYRCGTRQTLFNWRLGAEQRAEDLWRTSYEQRDNGSADCGSLRTGASDVGAARGVRGTDSGRQ